MSAPTPFGKYQLIDRISLGGMAEVFRAKLQNDRTEKLFAIKKILPSLCEDTNFIKMFVEEARLAGQLIHPNICALHELGRVDGAHFLAMEYIWGKDLIQVRTKLRKAKQKVPLEICVFILARVLEGLDYAHKKRDPLGRMLGLVHRDLSPHNVLISYEGDVKVIDFGIAKADSRASMTQAGTLKGKFAYMSPEQVQGGKLDRRSDIFALGTLFYELVTGERLFFGESDFNTLERVRKVEVKPPRDVDPTIPEGIEAVIYKALAKEVENRYQWCNEMRADLEPFITIDQPVVGAWMHQVFAAEIPVEKEQIEFGLANGRARPTPTSMAVPEIPKVAIPAPASLPPRRGGPIVVEDQRSRSGSAGSRPGQNVHVEDNRSKVGGIRAASSVHVEDNRSKVGAFRAPSAPVATPEREPSRPNEAPKLRRISSPMPVPAPIPTPPPPPPPPVPAPPVVAEAAARAPRRTKAPSFGDDFNDEPATQASTPSFSEEDWVEPQQPMDWSEALELSEAGTPRPKWPGAAAAAAPIVPTQTARERPGKFTDKLAAAEPPQWSEPDPAWGQQVWSEAETTTPPMIVEVEPPTDTLDLPADPTLDFLDLDAAPAPEEFLDLNVEVAPPDDEPPPPSPPEPAPAPSNQVLRLGGRKFRPNNR